MIIFSRTQSAFDTPFDPTDTSASAAGFTSTDTQSAIVEAVQKSIDKTCFTVVFSRDGTASANNWLYYGTTTPSNQMPFYSFQNLVLIQYFLTTQAGSSAILRVRNVNTNADILSIQLSSATLYTGSPNLLVTQGQRIGVLITNASINRPCLTLIFRLE
ncbi:MAG: hypothetical protein QXT45_04310 [Candidatus Bilamarchaeaceae archaeon]